MSYSLCEQVHLQTQQLVEKRFVTMAASILKNHGLLAFYNGLTASLTRQVSVVLSSVR